MQKGVGQGRSEIMRISNLVKRNVECRMEETLDDCDLEWNEKTGKGKFYLSDKR